MAVTLDAPAPEDLIEAICALDGFYSGRAVNF